jgi:hypothetical protein
MPTGLAEVTIKAAMGFATGKVMAAGVVPVAISQLVQGEIRAVVLAKLLSIAAGVVATGLVVTGIGMVVVGAEKASSAPGAAAPAPVKGAISAPLALRSDATVKAQNEPSAAPPPAQAAQAPANGDDRQARATSRQKLMNLGVAMNDLARDRGRNRLPSAAIQKDGKPLLSWRVTLLPFLGEQALYNKFHLDEPWDGPHNKPLLDQMPDIYAPINPKDEESRHSTYYQVFAGPGALFGGNEGTGLGEIKDGATFTIMVVEAARPVPWTKPEDLPFDKEKPVPELGGVFKEGFHALTAGGSVRFLRRPLNPEVLRALITPNGGEAVSFDDLKR